MGRATGNPNAAKTSQPVAATAQNIRNGSYQKDQAAQKAAAESRSDNKKLAAAGTIGGTKEASAIDWTSATAVVGKSFPKFKLSKYPSDLDETRHFKLYYYDYSRETFNTPATLEGKECILLPLPSNLTEKTNPVWEAKGMGAFSGVAMGGVNAFVDGMQSKQGGKLGAQMRAGVSALKNYGKEQKANVPEAILAATGMGLKALNETMGNMFDMATGTTPNPHLTMLFKGVNLRQHSFRWRFAPESAEESKALRNIITTLKAISLPERGQFLLGYPGIVKPVINIDGGDGYKELFTMKECVIMGIDVNYAPSGVPAFFQDTGAPVEIELSLSLQEIRIVSRGDYEKELNSIVSSPVGTDDTAGKGV